MSHAAARLDAQEFQKDLDVDDCEFGLARSFPTPRWFRRFAWVVDAVTPDVLAPLCAGFLGLMGKRARILKLSHERKRARLSCGTNYTAALWEPRAADRTLSGVARSRDRGLDSKRRVSS